MKRRDIFKEFLTTIFCSTTVKASGGKIYRSGDWFSTCDFGDKAFESYVSLLKIAYSNSEPQMQQPGYLPKAFPRTESIQRFFSYLKSYSSMLTLPDANDAYANTYAYKAAITLLSAIFKKSDNRDIFDIENEDISLEFRNALACIKTNSVARDIKAVFNAVDVANSNKNYFYDVDYSDDNSKYNYCLPIFETSVIPHASRIIQPISLYIYIDPVQNYNEHSTAFLNRITSSFMPFPEKERQSYTKDGIWLCKPLSLKPIYYYESSFAYVTHLDDATILNDYKCANINDLVQLVIQKAVKQYTSYIAPSIAEYENSLVDYLEDLIRRILSLDLKWLYNSSKKEIEKCREEVKKILIGYPEVFSYIDCCSDEIIQQQLLTILHHAITEITKFINDNGKDIAGYANAHNCENHIKYIKGKRTRDNSKELTELSEKLKAVPNKEPHNLYECYYYTSSNELYDLLNSISNYKNYFKKSKKSS